MKVFFTIITKSYLAQARVLAAQLAEFHPNIKYLVFLVDNPDGYFEPKEEKFEIIQLSEILDPDWWPKVTGYYTAYELCNAAKPFAHEYLLKKKGFDCTVYLDSDIYILGSLQCAFDELEGHSFLITPHLIKPDISLSQEIIELGILWSGVFNGGFVAINFCDESLAFLEWWKNRLVWNCTHQRGFREVDQSWLSFAPVYYDNCKISKNPSLNIAYWNFHERNLILSEDEYVIAGDRKAVMLHLSGWDLNVPEKLTKYDVFIHKMNLAESRAWEFMSKRYFSLLNDAGVELFSTFPYSFDTANDGSIITPEMRKNYLRRLREAIKNKEFLRSIFEYPEDYKEATKNAKKTSFRLALREVMLAAKIAIQRRITAFSLHESKSNIRE